MLGADLKRVSVIGFSGLIESRCLSPLTISCPNIRAQAKTCVLKVEVGFISLKS